MTKKGTKPAADAANQAEEAIKTAEMLEKIAKDAVDAAAQAREEAEQAKKLAKKATKKSKTEKVISTDDQVDRKFILNYLQSHSLNLFKKIGNLHDVRFEDDPARIVMVVVPGPSGVVEIPKLIHENIEIPVEVEEKRPSSVTLVANTLDNESAIVSDNENEKPEEDETYHRSIEGKAAEVLGITEALGPHSANNPPLAKNSEAYEAWLKRHPAVKVQK